MRMIITAWSLAVFCLAGSPFLLILAVSHIAANLTASRHPPEHSAPRSLVRDDHKVYWLSSLHSFCNNFSRASYQFSLLPEICRPTTSFTFCNWPNALLRLIQRLLSVRTPDVSDRYHRFHLINAFCLCTMTSLRKSYRHYPCWWSQKCCRCVSTYSRTGNVKKMALNTPMHNHALFTPQVAT